MRALAGCVFWFVGLSVSLLVQAEEPDDSRIIEHILQTRQALLETAPGTNLATSAVFLAVWDFDGTILKGDCSEGLTIAGQTVYRGLVEVAIESGLSELYPRDGFGRFWTDYTNMDTRIGHWLAYPFVPQMLRGARAGEVLRLSQSHFASTLSNYLMASSVKIIHALERGGVESHILSASADLFVKGAAQSLGVPANHIHGIEVRTRDGRLTEELVYPITWNAGKRDRLMQIIEEIECQPGGRKAFVLAGFGDSYNTDGPFLKFIATRSLPAGKPIAVFYDGKAAPPEYRGLFYQARHRATIGDHLK
ncbi:MAG TPA: haloacid dehalogenase-like hydrolase [Candidatus Acidoferrum sp.]|jgi:phosphoserine phosphatase|nr:haloacid dehalogenase-like hydrolase [Candidatus Acidoferrum sp.]